MMRNKKDVHSLLGFNRGPIQCSQHHFTLVKSYYTNISYNATSNQITVKPLENCFNPVRLSALSDDPIIW